MLTDTHCHLDFNWFDADRPAVLERAVQAGVGRILVPGLTGCSSGDVLALADKHPLLYAAVGVHPHEARTWNSQTCNALTQLAGNPKVVAIGEIGLDYFRDKAPREVQGQVLHEQLALAEKLGLPVLLHLRDVKDEECGPATEKMLQVLEAWVSGLKAKGSTLAQRPGVLHSFGGNLATATQAMELGFLLGITGPVTFRNAPLRQELVRQLPLDRLLLETDAPFLAPHPHRGQRNEPAYVALIADKIAELMNIPNQEVAAVTRENARRLFRWEN